MFKFNNNDESHMPFLAWSPEGDHKQLCCKKINGVWKVHYFDNGVWRKLATYTNTDTEECSPTAWYDPYENIWKITFIAGGSLQNDWADVEYKLYIKRGFDDTRPVEMLPADAGFAWKDTVVFSSKQAPVIYYYNGQMLTRIKLKGIECILRLSYDITNPTNLLITAELKDQKFISLGYDVNLNKINVYTDGNKPCYKMCTWIDENEVYYCLKNNDERHIVKASNLKCTSISPNLLIEEINEEDMDFVMMEKDEEQY